MSDQPVVVSDEHTHEFPDDNTSLDGGEIEVSDQTHESPQRHTGGDTTVSSAVPTHEHDRLLGANERGGAGTTVDVPTSESDGSDRRPKFDNIREWMDQIRGFCVTHQCGSTRKWATGCLCLLVVMGVFVAMAVSFLVTRSRTGGGDGDGEGYVPAGSFPGTTCKVSDSGVGIWCTSSFLTMPKPKILPMQMSDNAFRFTSVDAEGRDLRVFRTTTWRSNESKWVIRVMQMEGHFVEWRWTDVESNQTSSVVFFHTNPQLYFFVSNTIEQTGITMPASGCVYFNQTWITEELNEFVRSVLLGKTEAKIRHNSNDFILVEETVEIRTFPSPNSLFYNAETFSSVAQCVSNYKAKRVSEKACTTLNDDANLDISSLVIPEQAAPLVYQFLAVFTGHMIPAIAQHQSASPLVQIDTPSSSPPHLSPTHTTLQELKAFLTTYVITHAWDWETYTIKQIPFIDPPSSGLNLVTDQIASFPFLFVRQMLLESDSMEWPQAIGRVLISFRQCVSQFEDVFSSWNGTTAGCSNVACSCVSQLLTNLSPDTISMFTCPPCTISGSSMATDSGCECFMASYFLYQLAQRLPCQYFKSCTAASIPLFPSRLPDSKGERVIISAHLSFACASCSCNGFPEFQTKAFASN